MSLTNNKTKIQSLLDGINALPNAGGGGAEVPTLTNEGAAVDLVTGKELINSSGEVVTGTNPSAKAETDATVSTQADLIAQIQTALAGKTAASPGGGGNVEMCTVTIGNRAPAFSANFWYMNENMEINSINIKSPGSLAVAKNTILAIQGWSTMSSASGSYEEIGQTSMCTAYVITGDCTLTYDG